MAINRYNRAIYTKGTAKYSDLDMAFRANPMTGDILIKTDLDAIKQSVTNLLYTYAGERPFQPAVAGNLGRLLFEPLDSITVKQIDFAIRTVIGNYEPRISIITLVINDSPDQNQLNITMTFNIVNASAPQTITVILKRTR